MLKILENCVDFSKLGNHEANELRAETKKAVISEQDRILYLELELNFVLPVESIDKFKRSLTGRLKGIEDVKLDISYRDLAQTLDEYMPMYIQHMIGIVNGKFAHVTKTIYADDFI